MIEKFAAKGELGSAMAVGHEAEVADAMETVGDSSGLSFMIFVAP